MKLLSSEGKTEPELYIQALKYFIRQNMSNLDNTVESLAVRRRVVMSDDVDDVPLHGSTSKISMDKLNIDMKEEDEELNNDDEDDIYSETSSDSSSVVSNDENVLDDMDNDNGETSAANVKETETKRNAKIIKAAMKKYI